MKIVMRGVDGSERLEVWQDNVLVGVIKYVAGEDALYFDDVFACRKEQDDPVGQEQWGYYESEVTRMARMLGSNQQVLPWPTK